MPGLTIEEKKRRAEKPPEIEHGPKKRTLTRRRTWEEKFEALVAFQNLHGHCRVPLRYPEDTALGQWVVGIRNDASRISLEQKEKLDELGFSWETTLQRNDRVWHETLERLKAYRREHGDCRVPQKWKDDPQLAKWVSAQRTKQADGKLSPDYEKKLNHIGFTWRQKIVNRDKSTYFEKWYCQYSKLVNFHQKHGHCMVPIIYKEDKTFGYWVAKQREKKRDGKLADEQVELLDKLNFVWKIDKADVHASLSQREWEKMFNHLVEFKKKFGHVQVSRKFTKWSLGSWLNTQREKARKGKLDPRRAEKLRQLGVTWGKDFEGRWEDGLERLRKFKKQNGHCRVPINPPRDSSERGFDRKLANWTHNQRTFKKTGVLLSERRKILDEIGFVWCGETGTKKHRKHGDKEVKESGNSEDIGTDDDFGGNHETALPSSLSSRTLSSKKRPNSLPSSEKIDGTSSSDSEFEFDDNCV